MITISNSGRLGNAMFRNCAASILSKKFDIKVESYPRITELEILNPQFHNTGTKIYDTQRTVRYTNFLNILQQSSIDCGLNLICPCQDNDFILNYKKEILTQFDLQYDLQHKNDLFVHVRLGDCVELKRNLNVEYYIKAIEQAKFNNGYISSDTPSHEIITHLKNKFNLTIYDQRRAATINFAKNFGNLILSRGTFSWWMGFLSQSANIFYARGGPKWDKDIFGFSDWTPIDVDGD